jgi:tetratricopeptide (TPR) repeat protein
VRVHAPIALPLVVLTVAVYLPVHSFDFVNYDDFDYVVENPNLRGGLSLASVVHPFTHALGTNWFPINLLSLQLDHAAYGIEPGGYHVTNLALHILASLVLFWTLARMTGAPWRSGVIAAVFAVHPLHVESVAWISERKDVLSGLFWMLTMAAYARFAERPGAARMAVVALCLALGLMAKPLLVTLPFALLLLDYWPLCRLDDEDDPTRLDLSRVRAAVIEKWPLFALIATSSAITVVVQREGGAMDFGEQLSAGLRLANGLESYVAYLWASFWPVDLAVFYPHPETISWAWAGASGTILLAISVATFALRNTASYALVGWLWFLGTLVPMIGWIQVGMQARADRYSYIPQIGLAIVVVFGAHDLLGRSRAGRAGLGVLAAAAIAALALTASAQLTHWKDTVTLFSRAAAVTANNFVAHRSLGKALVASGRLDEAEAQFLEALRIRPGWSEARLGLADVLVQRGRVTEAIDAYADTQRANPDDVEAAGKYGLALLRVGRFDEAAPLIKRALAANPGAPELHLGMALAANARGDPARAIRHNREALRLTPDLAAAANNLAWLLATCPDPALRDPAESIRLARASVEASGARDPGVLDTLAAALAAEGHYEEAARSADRGAELAEGAGRRALGQAIRARAALYRTGRPYLDIPAR